MATATVTMSQLRPNGPPNIHTGTVFTGSHLLVAASGGQATTISPSTVILAVKVPNGATIYDFMGSIATGGAGQTLTLGTSNTNSGIMSIMTICQTFSFSASISLDVLTQVTEGPHDQKWFRAPGGTRGAMKNLLPVRISLSDDVSPANVWVQARLSVACSDSAVFTFGLFYTMDGLLGRTTIR
jgi:hypothetical protein